MLVEIMPYTPRWATEFAALAAPIRARLGADAIRIDHIGSTSVPGLAAKDIIDLQLSVAALEPLERYAGPLSTLGYMLRPDVTCDHRPPDAAGPDEDWQKRYFGRPGHARRVHLHVRVIGRPNQRYPLLFRDYLRAMPAMAAAYAELKRRLAAHFPDDMATYADVKDPACDLISGAAEAWALTTGWQPGPTDV